MGDKVRAYIGREKGRGSGRGHGNLNRLFSPVGFEVLVVRRFVHVNLAAVRTKGWDDQPLPRVPQETVTKGRAKCRKERIGRILREDIVFCARQPILGTWEYSFTPLSCRILGFRPESNRARGQAQ